MPREEAVGLYGLFEASGRFLSPALASAAGSAEPVLSYDGGGSSLEAPSVDGAGVSGRSHCDFPVMRFT